MNEWRVSNTKKNHSVCFESVKLIIKIAFSPENTLYSRSIYPVWSPALQPHPMNDNKTIMRLHNKYCPPPPDDGTSTVPDTVGVQVGVVVGVAVAGGVTGSAA